MIPSLPAACPRSADHRCQSILQKIGWYWDLWSALGLSSYCFCLSYRLNCCRCSHGLALKPTSFCHLILTSSWNLASSDGGAHVSPRFVTSVIVPCLTPASTREVTCFHLCGWPSLVPDPNLGQKSKRIIEETVQRSSNSFIVLSSWLFDCSEESMADSWRPSQGCTSFGLHRCWYPCLPASSPITISTVLTASSHVQFAIDVLRASIVLLEFLSFDQVCLIYVEDSSYEL